jgi:hypothetical protein
MPVEIGIAFVMLVLTFFGFLAFDSEYRENEPDEPNQMPRFRARSRFGISGNAHDRRLVRRHQQRTQMLAVDQTPTRGARGAWRRTLDGESMPYL